MRVGFITSILWSRYGQFWTRLAADAGAQVVHADPERTAANLSQRFIREIPSLAFRLATAEALALADCDFIVTPHPNVGTSSVRGGGTDPWISEFPELLAAEAGLQNVFGVPARLGQDVEPLAVTFLQELLHDGWRTRMIMERHRPLLNAPVAGPPALSRQDMTAVVAQPWLLADRLVAAVVPDGLERRISQAQLAPSLLLTEAARQFEGLVDTDLEVLGAVRWFTRKGAVGRIVMLVDGDSRADGWLAGQARAATHKPFTEIVIQEAAIDPGQLAGLVLGGREAG